MTVAPHAGAWIEISDVVAAALGSKGSPLTQGRGLKFEIKTTEIQNSKQSPLTQGRGLK